MRDRLNSWNCAFNRSTSMNYKSKNHPNQFPEHLWLCPLYGAASHRKKWWRIRSLWDRSARACMAVGLVHLWRITPHLYQYSMCAMWLFGAHGLRIMGKYMGKLGMHVSLKNVKSTPSKSCICFEMFWHRYLMLSCCAWCFFQHNIRPALPRILEISCSSSP